MATQVGSIGSEFRIGRVLGRSAGIWARGIAPLTLICLLAGLPAYLPNFLQGSWVLTSHQSFRFLPLTLTTLITGPLNYGIFAVAVLQNLSGGPMRIGAAIRQSFASIVPLVACYICTVLAMAGGMILLVIPGLIVMTMLSVSVQACVIERLGPIASLSRSAALTKGNRWRVFGLILIAGLVSLGTAALASPLTRFLGIPGVILAFLLVGVAAAYRDTVLAVQFNDLRVSKEGIGTERIAAVFD
jgi:hypothetical protein